MSSISAFRGKAIRSRRSAAGTVASLMEVPSQNTTADLDISLDLFGNGKDVENWALKKTIETAKGPKRVLEMPLKAQVLAEAYVRAGKVTGEYAKTFYLGAFRVKYLMAI
jgi:hypothetical protein